MARLGFSSGDWRLLARPAFKKMTKGVDSILPLGFLGAVAGSTLFQKNGGHLPSKTDLSLREGARHSEQEDVQRETEGAWDGKYKLQRSLNNPNKNWTGSVLDLT